MEAQPRVDPLMVVGRESSSSKETQTPKSLVGSAASHIRTFEPITENAVSDECPFLNLLASTLKEFSSYVIEIQPPIFYLVENNHYVIMNDDLKEFLKGACINIPILLVYQLFLMDEYADYFGRSLVSLLCPAKLSGDSARKHPSKYRDYLRDAFMIESTKKDKQCKFLLAPYNEDLNWMPFVIDLQAGEVYVFNSGKDENYRSRKIYPHLNMAFQIYKSHGGKTTKTNSKELEFIPLKCAKQCGGAESGYYTMTFMHEIVSSYCNCDNLKDVYFGTWSPYTTQELNTIREQWANFFSSGYISK